MWVQRVWKYSPADPMGSDIKRLDCRLCDTNAEFPADIRTGFSDSVSPPFSILKEVSVGRPLVQFYEKLSCLNPGGICFVLILEAVSIIERCRLSFRLESDCCLDLEHGRYF